MKKSNHSEAAELLNCIQACNFLKLNGRNRRVCEKKHSGEEFTVEDWEILLRKDKLLK